MHIKLGTLLVNFYIKLAFMCLFILSWEYDIKKRKEGQSILDVGLSDTYIILRFAFL